MRRAVAVISLTLVASACVTTTSVPSPTVATVPATASPTPSRPSFAPSTYMATLQARGKIRIGTREDDPPFSQRDGATGAWSGFDVDIGREMARAIFGPAADLDTTIEYVPVTSATRIPSLTADKVDVVIQTLTITDERKKEIDMSDPYYVTGQRLLIKRSDDTIMDFGDLGPDKTVCVQRGAPAEKDIRAATGGRARVLLLDGHPACLDALHEGATDAISTDEAILFGLIKKDPNAKIVGRPLSAEGYAIGVKHDQGGDRAGLEGSINVWLSGLISSGTWQHIYEKDITPISGDTQKAPGVAAPGSPSPRPTP